MKNEKIVEILKKLTNYLIEINGELDDEKFEEEITLRHKALWKIYDTLEEDSSK